MKMTTSMIRKYFFDIFALISDIRKTLPPPSGNRENATIRATYHKREPSPRTKLDTTTSCRAWRFSIKEPEPGFGLETLARLSFTLFRSPTGSRPSPCRRRPGPTLVQKPLVMGSSPHRQQFVLIEPPIVLQGLETGDQQTEQELDKSSTSHAIPTLSVHLSFCVYKPSSFWGLVTIICSISQALIPAATSRPTNSLRPATGGMLCGCP